MDSIQVRSLLLQTGFVSSPDTFFYSPQNMLAVKLPDTLRYGAIIDPVSRIQPIRQVLPFYLAPNGDPLLLNGRIVVAFLPTVSRQTIDSLNGLRGMVVVRPLPGLTNVFLLEPQVYQFPDIVSICTAYALSGLVRYAEPARTSTMRPSGYTLWDHYHGFQTHVKKIIGTFNDKSVWDFHGLTRIKKVAILDDAFESHEDIDGIRFDLGYDFADYDYDVTPYPVLADTDTHGMGVMGIIAASHTRDEAGGALTSSGIFGLNPSAEVIPIKIYFNWGPGVDDYDLGSAFLWAYDQGADVINCSWNMYSQIYWPMFNLGDYITTVHEQGRNGKGIPIIASSGNWANTYAPVLFPASWPGVLAVGGIDLTDHRWSSSNYGSDLDVVAPTGDIRFLGSLWTIDRMGSLGANTLLAEVVHQGQTWPIEWDCDYRGTNNENYDCHFGGTSASAAMASGIASLLISKDSMLTADQIYEIIRRSAVTNLGWGAIEPPDLEYGWGRIDAFRAVLSVSHGDVNNDGYIANLQDLALLVAYLTNPPATKPQLFPSLLLADWNCSGVVDLTDLSCLTSYLDIGVPLPVKPCYRF